MHLNMSDIKNMQSEYAANWTKMLRSFSKPMEEIAELNFETWKEFTRQSGGLSGMSDMAQAKKPDDIAWNLIKMSNQIQMANLDYFRKLSTICSDYMEEVNELYADLYQRTANKSSEIFRQEANKHKGQTRDK